MHYEHVHFDIDLVEMKQNINCPSVLNKGLYVTCPRVS